ncbi:MAG: hypothetical protein M1827_006662 [Pycnora praestabilis]|nr:MAG: hypothetical protein M1827_006662 [Pycnora praestabilis]
MDIQNDAVFVEEPNLDSRLRSNIRREGDDSEEEARSPVRRSRDKNTYSIEDEESPLLTEDDDDGGTPREGHGKHPSWHGEGDFDGLPWWNRPSIYWLLPPFLLFTLAFGGSMVPKLNLILTLICRQYLVDRAVNDPSYQFMPVIVGGENPQCRIPEVQSLVANFTLYANLLSGILCAFTSPVLGALSDRYGRKKIIIITTSGMLVGELITIIAASCPDTVSVYWLLLGYLSDGLAGSFIAAMALAHAYATDCTPPARRNVVFAYFHGALFTGIAVGPILAGYVVKWSGKLVTVFYLTLFAHFFFICFLLSVVPESLTKERQHAAREKYRIEREDTGDNSWIQSFKDANPFAPLAILYPTGEGSNTAVRANLLILSAVDTIMFGVAMGGMTVVIIYTNYMFGWETFESSKFVSIVNASRVCMLLIVLPLVTRLVRGRPGSIPQRNSGSDMLDLSIIRVAVFFDMMGYIGYAVARSGTVFILSGVLASLGGVGSPTLQAALTKHVPPDRTGRLLGATGLLHALARVVAPTFFNLLYSLTVGKFTQTVFVCLAATFGVAFVLSWFIRPHIYLDEPGAPMPRDDSTAEEDLVQ